MYVLLGLACALICARPGVAAAQPVATPPATPPAAAASPQQPYSPHPPAGFGGAFTLGAAGMAGAPTAWLARLDFDLFPVLAPHDQPGPILGFQTGWEYWRSNEDWGLALPFAIVLGIRAQPVRATLGLGIDALLVDVVAGDTGVGLYAPFASVRLGADVLGFQLGADARITRRWQIGAPDHTQWQLGVFAGGTWETDPSDRRPRY